MLRTNATSIEDGDEHAVDSFGRVLSYGLGAVGVLGLVLLALSSGGRVGYAYPLEWMEGASLQHAEWLARGRSPYAAPSAELIAYVYPPLAYAPVALTGMVFGWSLPLARVPSLLCTIATLAFLGIAATRLARSRAAGLFSAGLFAFGFGYCGAFLDLVRVDACFVLCIAAALERLTKGRNTAALGWLVASALAKQHGVILLGAVSAAWLVREPKPAMRPVLAAWLALGVLYGALQLWSGGWLARYLIEVPAQHGIEPALLVSFLLVDLLLYLPVLTIPTVLGLARRARALTELDALVLGAIAASMLGRAHPGGDDNVRLPAFLVLCAVGVAPLAAKVLRASHDASEVGAGTGRRTRGWLTFALCAQAAVLFQPPSLYAPRSSQGFDMLAAELERCANGGTAVALDYALLTGRPFLHTMALSDLRLGGDTELARAGTRALLDALRGPNAPRAIAVGERFPELAAVLRERYALCADLTAPHMATGYEPGLPKHDAEPRQLVYALRPEH